MMQFESFHWLSHRQLGDIIECLHVTSSKFHCFFLRARFRKSVDQIAKVSSCYLHHLAAAILEDQVSSPTWRLHTKLYNFAWNISTNISTLGQRTHRKLRRLFFFYSSFIISQFHDQIHYLVFDFTFYCVTIHTCFSMVDEFLACTFTHKKK